MVSFTNCKASLVSDEMKLPCTCSMYLLVENPFSGSLLPWDNDAAILKSDAISGNFGKPSSSKIFLSKEID